MVQNNNGDQITITCKKKRCGERFKVKKGKNDGTIRIAKCPVCRMPNEFSVDQNGRVHGPKHSH